MILHDRPTLLICNECGHTRIVDTIKVGKERAEQHGKLSKHRNFELIPLEDCPGRVRQAS